MTSLKEEQAAQSLWKPVPNFAECPWFDDLVASEFIEPERIVGMQNTKLMRLMRFCNLRVPYYRKLFACYGLSLADLTGISALYRLPILKKADLLENERAIQATQLPQGEGVAGWSTSSGATGRPTRVLMTKRSDMAFSLMMQRLLRWERWMPEGKMAEIRLAPTLPLLPGGERLKDGDTVGLKGWRFINHMFETGPYVGLNRTNSLDAQIEWLKRERPNYLVSYPGNLEALAYACQGLPVDSIKGVRSISAQLEEGVRRRLMSAFKLKIGQGYGLNEIGVVGGRCLAGRYHVNAEHCLVEILDEDGAPCKSGETGRIVVTGLNNFAMPLIRYDTSDLGVQVEGPCPCGRTLPSFGRIVGRNRDWKRTPQGTVQKLNFVNDTVAKVPISQLSNLREYRLHQFWDNRFELRLRTKGELPGEFYEKLGKAWQKRFRDEPPLTFKSVDKFEDAPSGKQSDFTSDFFGSSGSSGVTPL